MNTGTAASDTTDRVLGPAALAFVYKSPLERDAAYAVLSALLQDAAAVERVRHLLDAGDFVELRDRHVYEALIACAHRHGTTDPISVARELVTRGHFGEVDAKDCLGYLIDFTPTTALIEVHAEILRDASARRAIAAEFTRGLTDLSSASKSPRDIARGVSKQIVAIACAATEDPDSRARTLGDWLANMDGLQEPATVIPRLALRGYVTLLSGREKIGKSTLVASAVAAASNGALVLGETVAGPQTVLWCAIDERVDDAIRRFGRLGACPERLLITGLHKLGRNWTELLAALESDLAKFPAVQCVVVDTLSRVFAASGVNPNNSHEVEPVIANLVDFFHDRDLAALLLYHTSKPGKDYRGSTAIGANVDEVLTLRRRGPKAGQTDDDDFDDDTSDDGRRLLVQDGRHLRGRVHVTCVDGRYEVFEDGVLSRRQKLLKAVVDSAPVRSRSHLVALAQVQKQAGLEELDQLLQAGAIAEGPTGMKMTPLGVSMLSVSAAVPASQALQRTGTDENTSADTTQFQVPGGSALGNRVGTDNGNRQGAVGGLVPPRAHPSATNREPTSTRVRL